VGTFTQALYDEAKNDVWTVISIKKDWRRIFAFPTGMGFEHFYGFMGGDADQWTEAGD
jgi:hypothetical protein